ncbi:hypothetical protein [Siminovitchia sp. 179-K 8D1 HS]|uniref:hypothetical protein n=1 Tax=Siminovitchia sp. 179-K 8D1 HS TaxID=3142385 RepID=UPI0039A1B7A9
MPRKTENVGSQTTAHIDGTSENIINDPGLQNPTMGVITHDEDPPNPMHLANTKNKDMKEFEQYMRGDSLDK